MRFLIVMIILSILSAFHADAKEEKASIITLSDDNTISLKDEFNADTVNELMLSASKLNANLPSGYPIYLFLYTPGGSIQSGLELFEYLKGINRPIHTITLFAASMGWQAVQHLGDRYILQYGVLMSHRASGGFQGEFGGGFSQLDSRYGLWRRRIKLMDELTVKRTNGKQTLKSYTDAYTPELWLNGQEAVDKGYADKVVTVKCDSTMNGTYDQILDLGFIRLKVTFSKCPMFFRPLSIEPLVATTEGFMSLPSFIDKGGVFNCAGQSIDSIDLIRPKTLCALDSTLTVEKVLKIKEEKAKHYGKNLKDHVIKSY